MAVKRAFHGETVGEGLDPPARQQAGLKLLLEDTDRAVTAYHEAGYACAYVHYGIPFRWVAVHFRLRDDQTGAVRPLRYLAPVLTRGIICLAGPAAESRLARQPLARLLQVHCAVDRDMALDALRRDPTQRPTLAAVVEHTTALVAVEWPDIETLAAALLATERLDYSETRPDGGHQDGFPTFFRPKLFQGF